MWPESQTKSLLDQVRTPLLVPLQNTDSRATTNQKSDAMVKMLLKLDDSISTLFPVSYQVVFP
jgi:hypothetical protein